MVDNDVDRRVKKTQMKAFSPELNIENGEDSSADCSGPGCCPLSVPSEAGSSTAASGTFDLPRRVT
jgi:hypothetical protein